MKTTFLGKTASVLASASMLLATLAPLTASATSPHVYSISQTGSPIISGTMVSVQGIAGGHTYVGTLAQQNVAIDWDDDANASTIDAVPADSFVFTASDTADFDATWAGSHTYSTGGMRTLHAFVCHQSCTGAEGAQADASITIIIIIPPTTAGLSVKKVLINTGGGTAATSSFSFQINGGTATPFETDGENVFTLAAGPYSVVEAPAVHYSGYSNCSGTIVAGAATTTCTITNTFFNNPPVANNSSITTDEDTATSSSVTATDADSDSLTYSFGFPLHGILSFLNSLTGAFTYTPDANYNGTDSFTFSAADLYSSSVNGTVTITVTPVNDAPVAVDQSISTAQNVPLPGTLGASDVDGDTLTYATTTDPANGILSFFNPATGAFTYTPNNNYTGSDTFDFKANDGSLDSNTATVDVTVTESPENTPTLCSDGTDNDNDELIDLADPDCADFVPTLTVIKNVVNDNNGTATSSDFIMTVSGTNVSSTTFAGSVLGISITLGLGDYSVTESGPGGYTASTSESCSGTMSAGDNKTCTITNDDIAPTPPPVSKPQCSDGIDNDGDGRIDYSNDGSCSDANDDSEGNDGGGWFGGGQVLGASTTGGQVLGVSCGLYMDQHLRQGSAKNKPDQVTKLQQFLNKNGFGKFTPTGTFGPLTFAAAKAFQNKYANEILKPWNLSGPTGLVYLTTIRQLNLLECPELMLPLPVLVPWNQNPNAQ